MLELTVFRTVVNRDFTEGFLGIGKAKTFICQTLEDTIRAPKIKGITAIPAGTYPLSVRYSPGLNKRVVWIQDVPDFTYIYLHYGATVAQTAGCILVGKRTGPGQLVNIGMTDYLVYLLDFYKEIGEITIL